MKLIKIRISKFALVFLLAASSAAAQPSFSGDIILNNNITHDISPRWYSITADPFNAVYDSTTDNTVSIQRAIDSAEARRGVAFIPPGVWLVSNLTLDSHTVIYGMNATLKMKSGSTGNLLAISRHCGVYGLSFDGGNYTYDSLTAEGNRTAINITNASRCRLEGLTIKGFNEKGVEASGSDFIRMSGCHFRDNYYSIYLASGAEYWAITGVITHGKYGIFVGGGNNSVAASVFERAVYGLWMQQGSNGSHGSFTGCKFNHNTSANVYLSAITLGENFSDCHSYSGSWQAVGCSTVVWNNGSFGDCDIILDDGGRYVMQNNIIGANVTRTNLNTPVTDIAKNYEYNGGLSTIND